jgi:short-subunit dehydrogenase
MVERGSGRVLFTSSVAYQAVYNASKAFLQSFAQALRSELAGTGVTVTALMPGPTRTEFFRRNDMTDTKLAVSATDNPTTVARQGFEAMQAGKDHVVAGSLRNKVLATASRVVPDPIKAALHRRISEPGSANR